MNPPPLPYPQLPGNDYTGADMLAYGAKCRQQALQEATEQVRIGQGPRSSAEDAVKSLAGEVNCNRHPDAPHGFNRTASHNAGRYVCDCESWTPGEAS